MNRSLSEQVKIKSIEASEPEHFAPRILVTGPRGGSGTSTVAANVLAAQLGGSLFVVDTTHGRHYAADVARYHSEEIYELREDMMRCAEPVTVDLSGSAFAQFAEQMTCASISCSFDYCVLVADRSYQSQREIIRIYHAIRTLGMPNEGIKIVLNKALLNRQLHAQYANIFAYQLTHPDFPVSEHCVLPMHDLFRALDESAQTISQALADKTAYKPLIHDAVTAGDLGAQHRYIKKAMAQILASGGMENVIRRTFFELGILAHLKPRDSDCVRLAQLTSKKARV